MGRKEPQQQNLLKSNECLILRLGNQIGYVNSPTRKGGSRIQSRTLKFREIRNYFERLLRKICVILARHSGFFEFQRSADSVKSFNDVLRVAQRTLAECTQILFARCAEIPEILQNFRAISAQSLRDLNAGRALVRMLTQL